MGLRIVQEGNTMQTKKYYFLAISGRAATMLKRLSLAKQSNLLTANWGWRLRQ